MKTLKLTTFAALLSAFYLSTATAAPSVDTVTVQGYVKKANGTAVTDGTYNLVIGVCKLNCSSAANVLWVKKISTGVASGLFSADLTGAGDDLSADAGVPGSTNLNLNKTGYSLTPTNIAAVASGAIYVRVYAYDSIDGNKPTFDIPLNSVPTSFYAGAAGVASSVSAGVITSTSLDNGSAYTLPSQWSVPAAQLTGALPAISGANLTSVSAATLGGATFTAPGAIGSTTPSTGAFTTLSTTGAATLASATLNGDITMPAAASSIIQAASGSGALTIGTTNGQSILLTPNGAGVVTVGGTTPTLNSAANLTVRSASGSTTTVGNSGGASVLTLQSGTGGLNITSGATGALNLNASANGAVNIGTGTSTGTVTIGGTGAQTIAIGNGAAAKTVTLGSTNTTSTTNIQAGSGGVKINSGTAATRGLFFGSVAASVATSFAITLTGVTTSHLCFGSITGSVANGTATAYVLRAVATLNTCTVTTNANLAATGSSVVGCVCY